MVLRFISATTFFNVVHQSVNPPSVSFQDANKVKKGTVHISLSPKTKLMFVKGGTP